MEKPHKNHDKCHQESHKSVASRNVKPPKEENLFGSSFLSIYNTQRKHAFHQDFKVLSSFGHGNYRFDQENKRRLTLYKFFNIPLVREPLPCSYRDYKQRDQKIQNRREHCVLKRGTYLAKEAGSQEEGTARLISLRKTNVSFANLTS